MAESKRDYQASKDLLKDRVILVTGAGDGIGRAVSVALGAHGATVVLLGKTIKKLETTYDALVAAGAPKPGIYPMDLMGAKYKDYEDLVGVLEKEYGRLDGLRERAGRGRTDRLEKFRLNDQQGNGGDGKNQQRQFGPKLQCLLSAQRQMRHDQPDRERDGYSRPEGQARAFSI